MKSCVGLLLAALIVVNVYRAWTQSITYDEAITYDAFVVGPMSNAFTGYNANNHVLFTLLAKVTTAALGPSEFSLRLPSLVAGGVYFGVVFVLCRLLFGYGVIFGMASAGLVLNPFVLDFLSAARGYGLALALFLVAFHQVAVGIREALDVDTRSRRWVVVSLALAGSVCANLAFLFPAVGLGSAVLIWALFHSAGTSGTDVWRFCRTVLLPLAVPGIVTVAAFLAVPLSRADPEHFRYGASGLGETIASLVEASVRHHPTGPAVDRIAAMVAIVEARILIPLTLLMLLATSGLIATRAIRARGARPIERDDQLVLVLTGTLAATVAALVTANRLRDVPYPLDRTGLYFVPLFTLATALLAQRANSWGRGAPVVRAYAMALLALFVAQSIAQFNVSQYAMWRFDSGTRTLYDVTTEWPDSDNERPDRIVASQLLRPSLDYYRRIDGRSRVGAVSDVLEGTQSDAFDFAVVAAAVADDTERLRDLTRPVCLHRTSGAVLAVNRSSSAARALDSVLAGVARGADCDEVLSALRAAPAS